MTSICRALLWAGLPLALATGAAAQQRSEQSSRFAGAPRFGSTDGWSIKPRGRLQYDFGHISRPDGVAVAGLGSVDGIRRARLGVEGTMPGGFSYVFEAELSGDVVEITDATLSYKASRRLTFTVGQHNNFQSLDELTSTRFTTAVERAAFTDAFNFQRRLGVSATYAHGPLTAQAGLFGDNALDVGDPEGGTGIDGRLVYAPRIGDTQLHLGASAHWRDTSEAAASGVRTRYRQRPLIGVTDVRFIATPARAVREETHYGLEAAVIHGPVHAAAEAHWLNSDAASPGADASYFGGYAEIGWFLTGESRGYRGARWDRTRVRPGGAIEEGGFGAVQVNLRYDHLDLDTGGTQNGLIAALVWIPTDHVRFSLDYARIDYDDAAVPAAGGRRDYAVDVIAARAQIDF